MADNTKPAGNLPDWAYDDGGNNTAPNPALGADDITEPPGARKITGWEQGNIPPRNWMNWLAHKVGAFIRWLSENIAVAFGVGHHDNQAVDIDDDSIAGYHKVVRQRAFYDDDTPDRWLSRVLDNPTSMTTTGGFREYQDNGTSGDGSTWLVKNAYYISTVGWQFVDATKPAAAQRFGTGGTITTYTYPVGGVSPWADGGWIDITTTKIASAVHNDYGALTVKGALINSPNGAHGSGDHIGGGVGELAAAVTSGFWFPPQLANDAEPSGVPVNTTALGRMAWVVEQEKLRQFWRNASGWIDRPIVPIHASYRSIGSIENGAYQRFVDGEEPKPINLMLSEFDNPGSSDRMVGDCFALVSITALTKTIVVSGLHAADFPDGSFFHVYNTGAANLGWYTVDGDPVEGGGNTTITVVEAPGADSLAVGEVCNRRYIPGRGGVFRVGCCFNCEAVAGGTSGTLKVIVISCSTKPTFEKGWLHEQKGVANRTLINFGSILVSVASSTDPIWILGEALDVAPGSKLAITENPGENVNRIFIEEV